MPIDVRLVDEPFPHVLLDNEGAVSEADIADALFAAQKLHADHDVWVTLCDSTRLTGLPAAGTLFWVGHDVASTPSGHRLRMALLRPTEGPGRELTEFFETTARNRQLEVRVFTDRDAALRWLSGDDAEA